MTKQTIEVEGLPEGYRAIAYRKPKNETEIVFLGGTLRQASEINRSHEQLIVEKIQPRRIVLEETEETCNYETTQEFKIGNKSIGVWSTKILREVKETDLSLNSGEPKLSLSVDELIDANKSTWPDYLNEKISKFIKENS